MTRKISLLLAFFMCLALTESYAQDDKLKITAKPKDMWELGINVGHSILTGDVDWNSDFGVGLHLRKSLDYTFSVRLDGAYYRLNGEEEEDVRPVDANVYSQSANDGSFRGNWKPMYESSLITGDISILASLNQVKVFKKNKINPYAFVGLGITSISADALDGDSRVDILESRDFDDQWDISATANGGVGIGFLIGKKLSLSIEHKIVTIFGRGADLVDGVEFQGTLTDRIITPSDDLLNYTNLRLGIALGGKKDDKSVPLWWASPLDMIAEDLAEVKARPIFNDADTDGDGVLDMVDKEVDTPDGFPVDTRGVSLDSDGDGVVDGNDDEPFSPPGYQVSSKGVADVPVPVILNEEDVNKLIDARMPAPAPPANTDWFLPMIFFDLDKYSVKTSEYAKLHNVATVMRLNPDVRVVANGHTDRLAGNCYNDVLSYNRAQAAIDYLTTKYGISGDRFILNWGGENTTLIDSNSGNLMNRRVEFTVATTESAMGRPDCGVNNAGSGSGTKYSGNKEAGY